jgi:uncharacterized membrane protein YfcA
MHPFDNLSTAALGVVGAAAIVAGLARGFSGVGGALIFIPLASAAIGPKLAVAVLLVVDAVLAAGLIPNAWRVGHKPDVLLMALGAVVGVPLGTWILTQSDPIVIRWIMAGIVAAMLALLMSGLRYRGPTAAPVLIGVGALSGLFSGVAQIGGPPVLVYWLGRAAPAATVRANIVLYFALSTVLTIVSYLIGGLLTLAVLVLAVLTAPFYGLGLFVGSRLFGFASESTFRRVCYALIAGAALVGLPIFDGFIR